jgi:hypothetical protein
VEGNGLPLGLSAKLQPSLTPCAPVLSGDLETIVSSWPDLPRQGRIEKFEASRQVQRSRACCIPARGAKWPDGRRAVCRST